MTSASNRAKLRALNGWNPITSTKTRLVTTRSDGVRIYSHTARFVAGQYIAVKDSLNWLATESISVAMSHDFREG